MMKKLIILVVIFLLMLVSCKDKIQTNDTVTSKSSTSSQKGVSSISTSTQTTNSTTSIKSNTNNQTSIKVDVILYDDFSSIDEMISKAKKCKTVQDFYIISGDNINGRYYMPWSQRRLTMILNDRIILVPDFSNGLSFVSAELQAFGIYVIHVKNSKEQYASICIYTYENAKELKKKNIVFTANEKSVYYINDYKYYFFCNKYLISVESDDMKKNEIKEFISDLNFNTISLDK